MPFRYSFPLIPVSLLLCAGIARSASALPSPPAAAHPQDRVVLPVEDSERVTLSGNRLPLALRAFEVGPAPDEQKLEKILLVLKPDNAQQESLDALVDAQQDPASPLYHHWLTPQTYAKRFGVSDGDIEQVRSWLERSGLVVEEIAANNRTIIFGGTVAQVNAAFQTRMQRYRFAGKEHLANSSDPRIPAALAAVVGGVASLHDFFSEPQHHSSRISPEFNATSGHYLAPADFAAIYDLRSLYNQAYDGTGETIAIAGRADISVLDVRAFRRQFVLPSHDPVVVTTGKEPGRANSGDVDESMLDVEWAGAVANGATIDFVTSASTAVSDGVFLSAQYVVNHNLAPILSVSYGLCEAALGAAGNSFLKALWQQAAAQGISVVVSSGDSGAAGCDAANAVKAGQGRGVNGICSTPSSTCVGGTEFSDNANPAVYWSAANGGGGASALGYIPEAAWNESGAGGLWATGGGASNTYSKPSWQTGPGVPADGRRDVPDVALTAAGHDGYLVLMNGSLYAFSGTSAAAPSFAGILAILEQKMRGRLGNVDSQLYKLAASQRTSGVKLFHDVTAGSNTVAGVTGYPAGVGYDLATGLGSVDAGKLVDAWAGGVAPALKPSLTLSLSKTSLSMGSGGTAVLSVTTSINGGFSSPIGFTVSGLPTGITAKFSPENVVAPGAGSVILTFKAAKTASLATFKLNLTASGAAGFASSPITLTVTGASATGRDQFLQPNAQF